jgi:bacteriocin-like protein
MKKSELTLDELNNVTGGMIKRDPIKPLIPPTTGPTFPIPEKPPIVAFR